MKRRTLLLAALLLSAAALAQPRPTLSLAAFPDFLLPLGAGMGELYSYGYGARLAGDLGAKALGARADLGFASIGAAVGDERLAIVSLGAGPRVGFRLGERLAVSAAVEGGYALLVGPSVTAGNPFAAAFAGASFSLSPSFSLGIEAGYRAHLNASGMDYQGIGLSLAATFGLGKDRTAPRLRIRGVELEPVFPVFYKYYDTNPVGSVEIENGEGGAVEDARVTFLVPQFMAGPKDCGRLGRLRAGEVRRVPLTALFADSIIGVTEDTKVSGAVTVEYSYMGAPRRVTFEVSLRVYNRNAMTWDDDRRAAAFVSAKDPLVLSFAKTAAAVGREGGREVNLAFRQAMGLFQALAAYGLRYVPDPTSPFSGGGEASVSVDYLQFPAQTIEYKAGDCDDLSICYAAMLEATGTAAAFVTVPGHIFVAVDLGMDLAAAKQALTTPGDLVFVGGEAWLPVEVTMLRDGFAAAWRKAARLWREAGPAAVLLPIREAWSTYEAAAFVGGGKVDPFPAASAIAAAYSAESRRFVAAEIADRESAYRAELAAGGEAPKVRNKLGVLYARYGLLDKAEAEFARAQGYPPAMVNLGNAALERGDPSAAALAFSAVLAKDARSVAALGGLAQARFAQGRVQEARSLYERLKSLDPRAAARYAQLEAPPAGEGGDRAAEAARVQPVWCEE